MLYATTFNYCGFEIKAAQDDEGLEYIAEQTISVFTRNEKRLFRLRDFLKAKSTKTILGESYTCAKKLDNTDKNKKKQNWILVTYSLKLLQSSLRHSTLLS